MTTERKRRANQRNAQRSTDPKTLAGKARFKQNALKHGLSIPASGQPHLTDLLRELETSLEWDAVPTPSARDDLQAVWLPYWRCCARSIKAQILDQLIQHDDPSVGGATASNSSAADLMQHLLRADGYERRALSRQKSAICSLSQAIQRPR